MNFIIGLGSNVEERSSIIASTIEKLMSTFTKVSVSPVYETPAFGKESDESLRYCNAVATGGTDMGRDEFIKWLKEYELEAGRNRIDDIAGKIALDLDLVVWDHKIVRQTDFERPYFNIGYRYLLANGALEDN